MSYAGTLESYQGIELLISAFAEVRRELPDLFLLMIGGSESQVERYTGMARDLGLESDCLFTGAVDQPVAKQLLRRADLLTSPRLHGTNTPLKVYEQLSSGKPLVATRILSHTQVLTDEERRRKTAAAARRLYDTSYSRPVYEGKIRALLEILG